MNTSIINNRMQGTDYPPLEPTMPDSANAPLFQSYALGDLKLANRAVMAPMTRSRAIGGVPNELMAVYYAQRAGAGLLVTEGTSPSPNGLRTVPRGGRSDGGRARAPMTRRDGPGGWFVSRGDHDA